MTAPSGKFADLGTRVLSAIAMIVAATVLFELGGLWVVALLIVGASVMLWEYRNMLGHGLEKDNQTLAVMWVIALLGILVTYWINWRYGLIVAGIGTLALYRDDKVQWAWLAAGQFYINAASIAMMAIFLTPADGLFYVFWVVLIVALSDIGGYFAGRLIGGPKIWPAVSPKKTWSGTAGGWVLAIVAGAVLGLFGPVGVLESVLISLVVALAAQGGDFLESWIKRRSHVKDASDIIPGHGGLLDRVDGLIAAIMVFSVLRTAFL